jgi:cell division protein FtsL
MFEIYLLIFMMGNISKNQVHEKMYTQKKLHTNLLLCMLSSSVGQLYHCHTFRHMMKSNDEFALTLASRKNIFMQS